MSLAKGLSDTKHEIPIKSQVAQEWPRLDQVTGKPIAQSTNELTQLNINTLDVVRLKDGQKATIVEIFEDRAFYVDIGSSPEDWDTIFVTIDDVEAVIWRMPATE